MHDCLSDTVDSKDNHDDKDETEVTIPVIIIGKLFLIFRYDKL